MGERSLKSEKHSYEIRIKNHLDASWADWFDGWKITNFENGEAIFSCPDADHAALHGVLDKIRDLNLTLISVRQVDPGAWMDSLNQQKDEG